MREYICALMQFIIELGAFQVRKLAWSAILYRNRDLTEWCWVAYWFILLLNYYATPRSRILPTLKIEVTLSTRPTERHIPEDGNHHCHESENLKSCVLQPDETLYTEKCGNPGSNAVFLQLKILCLLQHAHEYVNILK
jgi:hypothetical protein